MKGTTTVECLHPGHHCRPLACPDCGRYSGHSWTTELHWTENGISQQWGGTCKTHGAWSDDAA